MDQVRGLQFTARRLATQLDVLILAIEESRSPYEIQELCREGRVVLDYAATVLVGRGISLTHTFRPLGQILSEPGGCLTRSSRGHIVKHARSAIRSTVARHPRCPVQAPRDT